MQTKHFYLASLTPLVLVASSLSYADQPVNVPTLEGGPTASITAWYAVTSAGNENYGFSGNHEDDANSVLNVTPEYNFGVDASLGYIFEDTANSIELLYRYQDTNNSDTDEGNLGHEGAGELHSELGYELNSFDLVIGQIIEVGESMDMRFTGGLAYVEIDESQHTSFHEELDYIEHSAEIDEKSHFSGWGPRVGIDARYDFGTGVGIVGGGSVAYVLGDLDTSESLTQTHHHHTEDELIKNDIDNHAVTNLRGNLGVDYVYFFDNEERSTMGIELGYQVDYYSDALGTVGSAEHPDIDTFALTFSGPYLTVKGAL